MTDFGDFENDDAFDTAPADPEQVARKLQRLRVGAGLSLDEWDALTDEQRLASVGVIVRLLAWLRRQGALR